MSVSIEASAPARICLGGESLDWMIKGPSVVGAIDLHTKTTFEELPTIGNFPIMFIHSKSPEKAELLKPWNEISWYRDMYLRYIESAVDLVRRKDEAPTSFSVTIESEIPAKAGVSSSSAVTLATVSAGSGFFGKDASVTDICEISYRVEHDKLRTGAGKMDFYACGIGGLLYLNCGTSPVQLESFIFPNDLGIVLVDTLTPHETKSFISSKKQRFENKEPKIIHYAEEAQGMVEALHNLLPTYADNREEIGSLLTRFHELLRDYACSSTALLDECVNTAVSNGALGAKLTGSGMGGCMFALVDLEHVDRVVQSLKKLPVRVYSTNIVPDGVTQPHVLESTAELLSI